MALDPLPVGAVVDEVETLYNGAGDTFIARYYWHWTDGVKRLDKQVTEVETGVPIDTESQFNSAISTMATAVAAAIAEE